MMAKLMIPIAMLLTLVLGGLPAAADDRHRDKREPKAEKIAHKLAKATDALYYEAHDSRRFHRSYAHRSALRGLRDLDRKAQAFHARVHRNGLHGYATQHAFRSLERAHAKAVYRIHALNGRHRLGSDVARVGHLIEKLDHRVARVDRRQDRRHRVASHRGNSRWGGSFAWNF